MSARTHAMILKAMIAVTVIGGGLFLTLLWADCIYAYQKGKDLEWKIG